MFGVIAMLLLVGYVASTKHFRREMDVTTFMSTICPIAAVAVLPLAVAHGDVFGLSGTGWTYMLILTFTSGVAAQGLLVFAQKSIQIGTIAIAQVAQPALAVVWSFLMLGEVVNNRQVAGIAIVSVGLLAFVVLNQRGARAAQAICLTARASVRSRSVMKCEAVSMRRSAASAQVPRAVATSPASSAMRASASRAKTSTGASSSLRAASRISAAVAARRPAT